jgi:hypothetical protein
MKNDKGSSSSGPYYGRSDSTPSARRQTYLSVPAKSKLGKNILAARRPISGGVLSDEENGPGDSADGEAEAKSGMEPETHVFVKQHDEQPASGEDTINHDKAIGTNEALKSRSKRRAMTKAPSTH